MPRDPLLSHVGRFITKMEEKDAEIAALKRDITTANATLDGLRGRLDTKDTEVASLDTRLKTLERP